MMSPKTGASLMTLSLVLVLFLAACGTATSAQTNAQPTSATTPTATTSVPTQHCGTVRTLGLRVVPTSDQGAQTVVDCFWRAYQQCHPATLIYTQSGVDTATIHTFSLQKRNGTCVVIDTVQHTMAPRPSGPSQTNICTGLSRQTDGLHVLACGKEGEVLVPTTTVQQP